MSDDSYFDRLNQPDTLRKAEESLTLADAMFKEMYTAESPAPSKMERGSIETDESGTFSDQKPSSHIDRAGIDYLEQFAKILLKDIRHGKDILIMAMEVWNGYKIKTWKDIREYQHIQMGLDTAYDQMCNKVFDSRFLDNFIWNKEATPEHEEQIVQQISQILRIAKGLNKLSLHLHDEGLQEGQPLTSDATVPQLFEDKDEWMKQAVE